MDAVVRKPKRFVHSQGLPFESMSPLEAWADERDSMRYVELKCPNVAEDWSWTAMSKPEDVRRLANWLIAAADWMQSIDAIQAGKEQDAGLR